MPPAEAPEREVFSVFALVNRARGHLESNFTSVWVEGEITNFKKHYSGHWYFTLKDDRAQIKVICPFGANARLRFEPHDGMQVIARGRLTIYPGQGSFQIEVETLEPKGIGAAELALRQLKEKLHKQGYFNQSRKRPLQRWPKRAALVTSAKGAAIRDMLQLFRTRWPFCEVIVRPCRVQGDGAADEIAASIRMLSELHRTKKLQFHAVIVGRGGGSAEDLSAFNEECVADAIFACSCPVISAVGHEIDWSIADMVADFRAETPSAAVSHFAPHQEEVRRNLGEYHARLREGIIRRLQFARQAVDHYASRPALKRPLQRLRDLEQRLDETADRLALAASRRIQKSNEKLAALAARLESLSPLNTLARGYSLTRTPDGKLLRDAAEAKPGDVIVTRLATGELTSRVEAS
jgi:exodeoxyribonuclease VII large subunit